MGTRSVTHVYEDKDRLVTMYRQMDGYPSCHGLELYQFLKDIDIVNGLSLNPLNVANGMSDLAAQLIHHFKDGPGSIYIVTPGDHGQEYEYTISYNERVMVKVQSVNIFKYKKTKIFYGTVKEFGEFCRHYHKE